jgi:hypothetical protein
MVIAPGMAADWGLGFLGFIVPQALGSRCCANRQVGHCAVRVGECRSQLCGQDDAGGGDFHLHLSQVDIDGPDARDSGQVISDYGHIAAIVHACDTKFMDYDSRHYGKVR